MHRNIHNITFSQKKLTDLKQASLEQRKPDCLTLLLCFVHHHIIFLRLYTLHLLPIMVFLLWTNLSPSFPHLFFHFPGPSLLQLFFCQKNWQKFLELVCILFSFFFSLFCMHCVVRKIHNNVTEGVSSFLRFLVPKKILCQFGFTYLLLPLRQSQPWTFQVLNYKYTAVTCVQGVDMREGSILSHEWFCDSQKTSQPCVAQRKEPTFITYYGSHARYFVLDFFERFTAE